MLLKVVSYSKNQAFTQATTGSLPTKIEYPEEQQLICQPTDI